MEDWKQQESFIQAFQKPQKDVSEAYPDANFTLSVFTSISTVEFYCMLEFIY